MNKHVLVAGKVHEAGLALLRARAGITVDLVEAVTTESYRPFLSTADAILIRTQPMTVHEIALAPRLQIVSRHGVGYDAVDVAALNARGNRFDAVELDGKTLLVLGFGRIGRRVAELGKAFGMTVFAFDPYVTAESMKSLDVRPAGTLDEALALADYVSVHMPGGKGPVLGAAELSNMKPGAIVVNAARGGVVDELALDKALRDRRLRAAALDVLMQEPPSPDHPLLSNPFVTISPHNAGLTEECARRMSIAAAQNILDCFDGRLNPALVVNEQSLSKIS